MGADRSGSGDATVADARRRAPQFAVRHQRLAVGALLLLACLPPLAARTMTSMLDRLAWSASLDRSASAVREVVLQRSRSDCGAAVLKMVLDHHGTANRTLESIEAAADTGPGGTSLLSLKRVAEQMGLMGQGLRLSIEHLSDVPMPVIAHVHGDHFVVVRHAGHEIIIDDPSIGRLRMSAGSFDRAWGWRGPRAPPPV